MWIVLYFIGEKFEVHKQTPLIILYFVQQQPEEKTLYMCNLELGL